MSDHPDIEKIAADTNGVIDGIPVRETIREIFRNPENGTPDKISRAGCLALSLRSNEVGRAAGEAKTHVLWNAWRTVFPTRGSNANRVDFSGVNFRKAPLELGLSFAGMEFGDFANFQAAQFGYYVYFTAARFGVLSTFQAAQFKKGVRFTAAQFGDYADFFGAQFGPNAIFTAVQFGAMADFRAAQFMNIANFSAMNWARIGKFYGARLEAVKEWASSHGLSPETFQSIDFSGATFEGKVSFSNRKFEDGTTFGLLPTDLKRQTVKRDKDGNAQRNDIGKLIFEDAQDQRRYTAFQRAPIFHGCELYQDTSFEGVKFPAPSGSEEAARAYRTLKLAFSKQQAVREEQLFYRLEMREEAVQHWRKIWFLLKQNHVPAACREALGFVFHLFYWAMADYGFSVFKPIILLVLSIVLFSSAYGASQGAMTCIVGSDACLFQPEWLKISILQSLPLFGLEKLEPSSHLSLCFSIALVAHKAVSLLAVFLIGLALRNLFKLK